MSAAGEGPERTRSTRESPSPRLEAVIDVFSAVFGRLGGVWRRLSSERRLAALAAGGLFLTLFLPWYQETVIARGVTNLRSLSDSMTGWGAFSFVEAALLLVAAGVIALLFARAEGRAFHVPGGDGGVITIAGGWACFLILWRMFDKQGTTGHGLYTTTSGIEWGIFVALAVAGVLTYAGTRIRQAHDPEPPLPGEIPRRQRRGRLVRAGRGGKGRPGPARRVQTPPDLVTRREDRLGGGDRDGGPHDARQPAGEGESQGKPERDAGRGPSRMTEFELDDTWIQVVPAAPRAGASPPAETPDVTPATAPRPRRRPRSIAEPQHDDHLTGRLDRPS